MDVSPSSFSTTIGAGFVGRLVADLHGMKKVWMVLRVTKADVDSGVYIRFVVNWKIQR